MENIIGKIKIFLSKYNNLYLRRIIIILIIIFALRLIDYYMYGSRKTYENENMQNTVLTKEEKIKQKEVKKSKEIINSFIWSCTNQRYEEAYDMLSKECKKEQFPDLQVFINNFINQKIDIKNKYYIGQEENGDIYYIDVTKNPLTTGGINQELYKIKCKLILENNITKITILKEGE